MRAADEKCSAYAILYILSQKGEKYAYFLPIGEKYAFSPLFLSPCNYFFPQPVIWPNKKIYTPAILVKVQIQLITTIVNITVRFIIDSF